MFRRSSSGYSTWERSWRPANQPRGSSSAIDPRIVCQKQVV